MKRKRQEGFTMIELVVVMATIGLLATLAIPSFRIVREQAESVAVAKDLRTMIAAIDILTTEKSDYPNYMDYDSIGAEEASFIPARWQGGENYQWYFANYPNHTYIYVYNLDFTPEQNTRIDSIIDDGNPGDGDLWVFASGIVYFFEWNPPN